MNGPNQLQIQNFPVFFETIWLSLTEIPVANKQNGVVKPVLISQKLSWKCGFVPSSITGDLQFWNEHDCFDMPYVSIIAPKNNLTSLMYV